MSIVRTDIYLKCDHDETREGEDTEHGDADVRGQVGILQLQQSPNEVHTEQAFECQHVQEDGELYSVQKHIQKK